MKDKIKIMQNLYDLFYKKITFEVMIKNMENFGVERIIFDCVNSEYIFYSKNEILHRFVMNELVTQQLNENWVLGEKLNLDKLQDQILKIDSGKIFPYEFHRGVYEAGVILSHVYLKVKKILYFDQVGDQYVEHY